MQEVARPRTTANAGTAQDGGDRPRRLREAIVKVKGEDAELLHRLSDRLSR
jgi:hypothetical protein